MQWTALVCSAVRAWLEGLVVSCVYLCSCWHSLQCCKVTRDSLSRRSISLTHTHVSRSAYGPGLTHRRRRGRLESYSSPRISWRTEQSGTGDLHHSSWSRATRDLSASPGESQQSLKIQDFKHYGQTPEIWLEIGEMRDHHSQSGHDLVPILLCGSGSLLLPFFLLFFFLRFFFFSDLWRNWSVI